MKRYVLRCKATADYWSWSDGLGTPDLSEARVFNQRRWPHDGWCKGEKEAWEWVPVTFSIKEATE